MNAAWALGLIVFGVVLTWASRRLDASAERERHHPPTHADALAALARIHREHHQ